jgi:NO-binding membrane sensor protein with MHYT domain
MSNYLHLSGTVSWDQSSHLRWTQVLVRLGAAVGVLVACWALYILVSPRLARHNQTTEKRIAVLP